MRKLFPCLAALALLGACATTSSPPENAAAAAAELSDYERAINTATMLEQAGNEQAAINRLSQLLAEPDLTAEEMAATLYARATLRYEEGNDIEGAIEDTQEILAKYPASDVSGAAASLLEEAEQSHAQLVRRLSGEVKPEERFEILFQLGRHLEAGDIMTANALQPDNAYLLDMYQIGHLCDGSSPGGRSYALVEPDGTERTVQFCNRMN